MADLLGTDPQTGFMTIQAADGSTHYMPPDVAMKAFPEFAPPLPQVPVLSAGPGDVAPISDVPAIAPPPQPTPVSAPHEYPALVPGGGAPAAAPSGGSSSGQSFSVHMNTAPPQKRVDVSPAGTLAGYDALGNQLVGAQREREAALQLQEEAANAVLPAKQEAAADTERLMHDEAARRQAAQADVDARLAEAEQRIDTTLASIPQSDPHRWWNSRTSFQRALGIAGAAASGFLTVGQGKNPVVEAVMDQIQLDMRAQESNIEVAKFKAGAAERGYGRLQGRLEADELASRELSLYKLETVKASLATKMASFGSQITQAEYAGLYAELDMRSQQERQALFEARHKAYMDDMQYKLQSALGFGNLEVARGNLALSVADHQAARDAAGAKARADAAGKVLATPTGFGVGITDARTGQVRRDAMPQGLTDKEVEDFRKSGPAATKMWEALDHLDNLSLDRIDNWSPDKRTEAAQYVDQALIASAAMGGEKIGRGMSDKDMELFKVALTGGKITDLVRLTSSTFSHDAIARTKAAVEEDMTRRVQAGGDHDVDWRPPPSVVQPEAHQPGAVYGQGRVEPSVEQSAQERLGRAGTGAGMSYAGRRAQVEGIYGESARIFDQVKAGTADPYVAAAAAMDMRRQARVLAPTDPGAAANLMHQADALDEEIKTQFLRHAKEGFSEALRRGDTEAPFRKQR